MPNPYLSLLRTAWQYARQEKKKYVFIYTLFVGANIVAALNPLLYGWFVDSIQRDTTGIWHNVLLYAGLFFLLKFLEWCFHGPARIMERDLAFNLSQNFLEELYHQTLHLPIRWHQDNHSGSTINRIRKAYEALKHFFQDGFLFLHAISKFVFSFAAMMYFSPLFGTIGIILGFFTVWVIFQFDKPFIKALDETNEKEHVVSSTLFDSLSNIITVITLRLEKRMESSLLKKVRDVLPPFRRNVRINEWKWFVADLLVTAIYCVIAVGYVYQHWTPGQPFYIGGLITLLGYVIQFTSVFHDVAWQYTNIVQYNTDIQTARSIGEAYRQHHLPDSMLTLPDNWKRIEIEGLNFSHNETYEEMKTAHSLHNLNIVIEKGKKIAFIGESGSGKSTLLALLRGLYDAEPNVKISVDGESHPSLDIISETVTLFPQEPEIFENTIAYNITLGLPFEEAEILKVSQTAHFSEVIQQLPRGLESSIQEKGVNLSGGQKQRLALARGVLAAKISDIVLLDEPTSSVDPKTEVQIYDRLFKEFKDKAVLSSLHRLHLLTKFDYVYILKDGRIIDEGTFAHLRKNSSVFQDLWKHQEQIQAKEVES